MSKELQKVYTTAWESEASLPENNSHKKMLNFIGEQKRVLDFGCATGYLARLLTQRGCQVFGVEISPDAAAIAEQFCEKVSVADLDFTSAAEIFPDEKFDVVVFGDVLEHLRDPWKTLEQVKSILHPDGYVVASIPNIAHGAIRLALMQGQFDYEQQGILDNTHLRFFTRKSVEDLFESTGYLINSFDRTITHIFSPSDVIPQLNREEFSPEVIQHIESQADSETLQFIIRAYPTTLEGQLIVLRERCTRLTTEQESLKRQIERQEADRHLLQEQLQQKQAEFEQVSLQLEQTQSHLHQTQSKVKQTQASLKQAQLQLKQAHEALKHSQTDVAAAQDQVNQLKTRRQEILERLQRVRGRLQRSEAAQQHAEAEVMAMKTSKFWKLRSAWFRVKGIFGLRENPFPELAIGSLVEAPVELKESAPLVHSGTQPQPVQSAPIPYDAHVAYQIWIKHHTPTASDLKTYANMVRVFAYHPLISVVMPVYNPPIAFLRAAIESVIQQVYPHWEFCIADDASPNPQVRQVLEEYARADERIKVVFREENGHISRSSNSALEVATGEFIALLDHDDVLAPEALYEMVLLLNQHPEADMIYSDEDKIDEEGQRKYPFFKPDWSPDSFLSRMYTCHLGVYRRSLITEIGGFRVGYEGSQDYDLVLRFTEKTNKIFHIPKILYHWRIHEQSASSGATAKPYAYIAGQRALADAIQRRGEPGRVEGVPNFPGHYVVRYDIQSSDLVSIIIPTRDLGHLLNQCLESIFEKSTYPHYEVIVVDNGSTEPYTEKVINTWLNREPDRFRCYTYNIPFNYSKINNFGVSKANGKYLVFLNNDTEIITTDWLEALVEQAQRPSIGAVGAKLLYSDNTIQHAGVVIGLGGFAGHGHRYFPDGEAGYYGTAISPTNFSAVTAACLICRREVFDAVGGFDEEMPVAFNDVDFCLKLTQAGLRNLCIPHVVLYHYESKSRGLEDTLEKQSRFQHDSQMMVDRWLDFVEQDPCYSKHLTLSHSDYRIREQSGDAEQLQLMMKLKQSQNTLKRVRGRLQETQGALEDSQRRIEAMKTSKFWKLRGLWFSVKRNLGATTSAENE
ncbi:MAG: glycosyltransferase [Oculatellaceae cyanobacterium Prado106]|jgi:glycosyltransferase involved in cell wall biosynthesis/2-polyprenyl-3-methyl-5-hydroxy-6-metoxy-1,4-benzoquinol methylase/peptidoglycan hydrolase CwlO-like protein|nr:glycosyltransferase [Oculatellaceae cyanobacterium Prado106]